MKWKRDPRSLNPLKRPYRRRPRYRCALPLDRKNRYVRQAQAEGLKLTDWIQKHMDNVCNDAGQPDTTPYTMNERIDEKNKI